MFFALLAVLGFRGTSWTTAPLERGRRATRTPYFIPAA